MCQWMTSFVKLEVHSVSQRRQRSHGHTSQASQNLVKIGRVVQEICSWTDRQTDTVITVLRLPYRGRSNKCAMRAGCGGRIASSGGKSGRITSPLYPKPYPTDVSCQFVFEGRSDERIQLRFSDFQLHYRHADAHEPHEYDMYDCL